MRLKDSYYMACVEINPKYFDDSIEIDLNDTLLKFTDVKINNDTLFKFTEVKINKEYPLKDKYDLIGYTRYLGCTRYSDDTKLYFQIEHRINLDRVDRKSFYRALCEKCYSENISTIIKDIKRRG